MADPATPVRRRTPSPGPQTAMRRPLRSSSQSPSRRRLGDELLSRLTPASAVEALRTPSGALKTCLDNATASEQSFALRTAVASKKIYDWLDEVSDWYWPGSPAGFEVPPAKRRKLSESSEGAKIQESSQIEKASPILETTYLGALPSKDVVRYEERLDQIQRDMDELDLEEIKSHILRTHIWPLSRPGTPYSPAKRAMTTSLQFTTMGDLTAVVTAITIQALPNLSKLSRLLNTWNIRLIVLRKVPTVLHNILDAEIALEAGWKSIEPGGSVDAAAATDSPRQPNHRLLLSKDEFYTMKAVLQQKVARSGRVLDFMLDSLEGMEDFLPEEWIDRIDAVEKDYADWVAAAEKRARQNELEEKYSSLESSPRPSEPVTPPPRVEVHPPSPAKLVNEGSESSQSSPPTPFDHSDVVSDITYSRTSSSHIPSIDGNDELHQENGLKTMIDEPDKEISGSVAQVVDLSQLAVHQRDVDSGIVIEDTNLNYNTSSHESLPGALATDSPESQQEAEHLPSQDIEIHAEVADEAPLSPRSKPLSEVDRNIVRLLPPEPITPAWADSQKATPDQEFEYSFLESVNEENEDDEEPELPPARYENLRPESQDSSTSTIIHGPNDGSYVDDGPWRGREQSVELDLPPLPNPDQPLSSDGISPPSSPPLHWKPRAASESFKDDEDATIRVTPPKSPFDLPEVFAPDTSYDFDRDNVSPSRMSTVSSVADDDVLHQQIRGVLESLPARIRLSSRSSAINLNPPDLHLPSRPKSKAPDRFRRSGSAMSTMSTTSFLMAPVKSSRPRTRNSQEARHYYLSRSNGEAPMKLLIRCVGENRERVMVRVGGGWADLGEYLKEYASHHSSRSKGEGKVEVKDLPRVPSRLDRSSPPSRPTSALDSSPVSPLSVQKTRKSLGEEGRPKMLPRAKMPTFATNDSSLIDFETDSRAEYDEEDSVLGLSGPNPKKRNSLSPESQKWVEDVKSKVRSVSGGEPNKFGEMSRVGGTKRLFRKSIGERGGATPK